MKPESRPAAARGPAAALLETGGTALSAAEAERATTAEGYAYSNSKLEQIFSNF